MFDKPPPDAAIVLAQIHELEGELMERFGGQMRTLPHLTRKLVSDQDNRGRPRSRWFRFKEAFSTTLVDRLLADFNVTRGAVLDPFAGVGTTLFAASARGLPSLGIELLPVGRAVINTRFTAGCLRPWEWDRVRHWRDARPWQSVLNGSEPPSLHHLRITAGAYPPEARTAISRYLAAVNAEEGGVRDVLATAALCVLESVSYTRKDGQYLRWDHRSGRRTRSPKPLNKGPLPSFDEAVAAKLTEFIDDAAAGPSELIATAALAGGSCLDVMPTLPEGEYAAVVTSPPHCNRYDYTRTYALELAMLGCTDQEVTDYRQAMLTCTVENRPKDLLAMQPAWAEAASAVAGIALLAAVLDFLTKMKAGRRLNNASIIRMVRGYFAEMACVIQECHRVLEPGGAVIMANDNVRYAGANIAVDLILAEIAERLGLTVEAILILPRGKGNSSQQMGGYGRSELRKCVYVWRKPAAAKES